MAGFRDLKEILFSTNRNLLAEDLELFGIKYFINREKYQIIWNKFFKNRISEITPNLIVFIKRGVLGCLTCISVIENHSSLVQTAF